MYNLLKRLLLIACVLFFVALFPCHENSPMYSFLNTLGVYKMNSISYLPQTLFGMCLTSYLIISYEPQCLRVLLNNPLYKGFGLHVVLIFALGMLLSLGVILFSYANVKDVFSALPYIFCANTLSAFLTLMFVEYISYQGYENKALFLYREKVQEKIDILLKIPEYISSRSLLEEAKLKGQNIYPQLPSYEFLFIMEEMNLLIDQPCRSKEKGLKNILKCS